MTEESRRIRVVVDTNQFVSGAISTQGNSFILLEAIRLRRVTLLISQEQRGELADVLSRRRLRERFGVSAEVRGRILTLVDTAGVRVPLALPVPMDVRDPKDVMILASALSGRAHYIVTGDDDLLSLDGAPALGALRIVTVRDFLAILAA